MDFNVEQKSLIFSLIDSQKISRISLIRRLLKLKKISDKGEYHMIEDAVRKLCKMTDHEYVAYDFSV